jgi:hypothetical protein
MSTFFRGITENVPSQKPALVFWIDHWKILVPELIHFTGYEFRQCNVLLPLIFIFVNWMINRRHFFVLIRQQASTFRNTVDRQRQKNLFKKLDRSFDNASEFACRRFD